MAHDVMVSGAIPSLASTTTAFIKSLPDGAQLSRNDDKTLISKTSPTVWEYEIFRMEWTRRTVLRYLEQMLRDDPITYRANKMFAATALRGGFDLKVTSDISQKEADRAQIILDDFKRRVRLDAKLYPWGRVALHYGDLFLNPVVDPAKHIILQIKSLPAISMQRNDDITGNFPDLRQAFQQIDPLSLQPLLELSLWQVNHIRWNYEDGQRYGRSQYLTCLQTWRKLNMTQQDLVIRRRTRAAPKRVHLVGNKDRPASDPEIDEYIVRNKMDGSTKDVVSDYFLNGLGDVKDLNADAMLDHIKDIQYLTEQHFLGTGVPMGLMGFAGDINRDVLEDQKKQFDEDVEELRQVMERGDGGTYSGVRALFDLELMLQGIDPTILEYNIIWHEEDDETPSERLERIVSMRQAEPSPLVSRKTSLRLIGPDIGLDNDDSIEQEIEQIEEEEAEARKEQQTEQGQLNPPQGAKPQQPNKPMTDSRENEGLTGDYKNVNIRGTGNDVFMPLHGDPRLMEMEKQIRSRVKGMFGTMAEGFILKQKKSMAKLANMQPTLATGLDSVTITIDPYTHMLLHGECDCMTDATEAQIHANANITPLVKAFAEDNVELHQMLKQLLGDLYMDVAPVARSNIVQDAKKHHLLGLSVIPLASSLLFGGDVAEGYSPIAPKVVDDKVRADLRRDASEHANMIMQTTQKMFAKALADALLHGDGEAALLQRVEDAITLPDWRARMIAETEIANAYNKNSIHAYRELGVTHVQWVAMMDSKTCKKCRDHNGEIFSVDDIPEIPAHPNCRCHLVGVATQ